MFRLLWGDAFCAGRSRRVTMPTANQANWPMFAILAVATAILVAFCLSPSIDLPPAGEDVSGTMQSSGE